MPRPFPKHAPPLHALLSDPCSPLLPQEQKADLDAMREVKLLGAKDLIRREGICLGLVFRGLRAPACVLQTSSFLQ